MAIGENRQLIRHTARPPWTMLASFFLLAATVVLIGILAYRAQAAAMTQEVFGDLQAVARLKIDGVSEWLGERRTSAAVFSRNPLTARLLARWLDRRSAGDLEALREVLHQEHGASGFDTIALFDTSGQLLLADGTPPEPGEIEPAALDQVGRSGEILFQDLRLRQSDSSVQLAFLAPIIEGNGAGRRLLAVAVLEADAGAYLYPYILSWPQPSDSGEAVLARRDGNEVLLLTDLRFRAHTRLRLRLPLSDTRLPTVRAALGERGPVEGIDYRGQRVLAAIAEVPGTPWLLIAKLDQHEALAEVRRLALMTAIMTLLAVACAAAAIALVWQRSQLRVAQVQAAQAEALRERVNLREYLAKIVGALPGAIYSTRVRPDGSMCIPYASPNLREVCGIDAAAVVSDAAPAFAAVHPEDLPAMQASIAEAIRTAAPWRHEFRLRHPEKGEIWLEARTVPEAESDGVSWQGFLWDITERKRQEATLRQAATVFTGTQEGVVITDPQAIVLAVNPAFTRVSGYDAEELVGRKMSMMQSGQHDAAFYRVMWESIHQQGYWQGEIWNRRKSGEIYPAWATISAVRNGHGEMTSCVGTFSDISRIKDSEARLRHLADHDSLTGLPNRGALIDTLSHAIVRCGRAGSSLAILFLDLDRFKNVNDSFGHVAGDDLLCQVARRLRARLRNADTLARLGGDEFVVLLEDIAGPEAVGQLAHELIEALSRPFTLQDGKEACVGCSIGISLFPRDSIDANELIQHADAALYRAKASGRGTYRFFETELTRAAVRRMETEGRLRHALECGEFSLRYQPLVSLADGHITGVEALLRWCPAGDGCEALPDFIPVAEDTGLIVPIGDWVLRSACAQIGEWRRRGQGPRVVSVNLSPHQFHRHDIVERVRAALEETGVDGACLELEITETALLHSGTESELKLRGLTALGVRLSIDDFGTGYSSLAYLKRLPISKLKIAQQFIHDLLQDAADTEITTAVISMGKSLKLEVLAEGVETRAQLDFLREHGCDTAQGFLFSKAVSGAEIDALCLNQPWVLQPAA